MWCWATPLVVALVFDGYFNTFGLAEKLSTDSQVSLSSDGNCNEECPHTRPKPVCGSDGRTYFSRCELQRQVKCDGNRVHFKHRGKCAEESRCRAERIRAQKAKRPLPAAFVPDCREDGSYADVQCHTPTGYCWCVTDTGMPIPGSSVSNKRPACSHYERPKNSAKRRSSRKERKGCTQVDRKNFNDNLVKIFLSEYNRLPMTSTVTTKATPLIDSREKRAVEWKFSELDRNGDYELDKKELQTLRRMLKKIVRPRTCARTFTKTCDQNQDRRINRAEWTLCLGVDMNNEQTEHLDKDDSSSVEKEVPPLWNRQITTLSAHVNPTDTNIKLADEDIGDCLSARQLAMDQQHTGGKGFVPECTVDGKYSKMQCFKPTGYCWCIDPDSGKTIPGTSRQNEKPDCDKSFKAYKPIKGCYPERKKHQFLNEMLDLMVKEMMLNQSAIEQKTDSSRNSQEIQEKAALHKYRLLDTNRNQVIDKKEWKEFKNEIKKRKVMRKCGRNFLKYCDDDNNRRVTEDEWISCLGLRDSKINNPSNKRQGENPLERFLNK